MASSSAEGPPPRGPGGGGAWPRIRGLLIGLVILLHLSLAAPWPDLGKRDLEYALAREELQRWSQRLAALGVEQSPEELRRRVLAVGAASKTVQARIHGPFRPLLRITGTGQAWGLFAYPDPFAGRLVVSGRGPLVPDWTLLYRAPGQGEDWMVALLENRKIRGIYDDKGDRPRPAVIYDRLCDWLAGRIFARDARLDQVEFRLDLVAIRVPGDPRPPVADQRRHVRLRSRGDLAGAPPEPSL